MVNVKFKKTPDYNMPGRRPSYWESNSHYTNSRFARCEICNKTNNSSVVLLDEDYGSMGYYKTETGYVCHDCESAHRDSVLYWQDIDDIDDEEEDEAFEYESE